MASLKETKRAPNPGVGGRRGRRGGRVSISTASSKGCWTDGSHKECVCACVCLCVWGKERERMCVCMYICAHACMSLWINNYSTGLGCQQKSGEIKEKAHISLFWPHLAKCVSNPNALTKHVLNLILLFIFFLTLKFPLKKKFKEITSNYSLLVLPCPKNCVTFDPQSSLVAIPFHR